jgi:hypothetical protein
MWDRRFVLAPLAEVAPDLKHPADGRTVTEVLASLDDGEVRRVGSLPRYRLPPYNRQPSGQVSVRAIARAASTELPDA